MSIIKKFSVYFGLFAILFSLPIAVFAVVAFIQDDTNIDEGTASTISKAFTSNVTKGDLIVVNVGWGTLSDIPTVSDTQGNIYSSTTLIQDAGFSQAGKLYYTIATSTGANTVTATFPNPVSFRRFHISEFSGIVNNNPLDVATGQVQLFPGTGTDAITSSNATTTVNGDLIYGHVQNTSQSNPCSATTTPGTGFTGLEVVGTPPGCARAEWRVQSIAGAVSSTFTATENLHWITHMAAFKAAPDPAPTTSTVKFIGSVSFRGNVIFR